MSFGGGEGTKKRKDYSVGARIKKFTKVWDSSRKKGGHWGREKGGLSFLNSVKRNCGRVKF